MASMIRGLLTGGADSSDGVVRHTVGNALVLHPEDGISAEAQSLALAVVEDAENDVVVLDLGDGMPIGSWEAMATVLPRRRRGIRLMACGRHRGTAPMAGQWFAERLNRTVVAPDGDLVRGPAGALFVHSGQGGGWVRFRPGRAPAWDAKRYPAPLWDRAATDRRASSSIGEIEPLPGGVWIHDVRGPDAVAEHRSRLTADVPCQAETMTVLLGCPGTDALPLDDVVRFWRDLDADTRERVRFVRYGDVRMPVGESFGQTLADQLAAPVVCYPGVPVGAPHKHEIRTVRADGVLGWAPFALELQYTPRAHPNSTALRPTVVSHRAPMPWAEEIAPRVFWYASDAVVEVVQSGLWVRSPEEPPNADRVRAALLDPDGGVLVFDDIVPDRGARMRDLAEDLAARVDLGGGEDTMLLAASALGPGRRAAGKAGARLTVTAPKSGTDAVAGPVEAPARPVADLVSAVEATAIVVEPSAAEAPEPVQEQVQPVQEQVQPVQKQVQPAREQVEPARERVEPVSAQIEPGLAQAEPVTEPVEPVVQRAEPVAPDREPPPPVAPAEPIMPVLTVEAISPIEPAEPTEPTKPMESAPPEAPADAPQPPAGRPEPPAGRPEPPAVGWQPVPDAAVSALLPDRPLTDERAWLRRTLSRDFDTMASSVSRLMSEHPGLQAATSAAGDVLADAVAARLYLSERGSAIDAGLRTAGNGPHVPFARCAVAGLSRLPSYRGATVSRVSPTPAEWQLYRERRLVTEWGFALALNAPCAAQEGDTDLLIWSMTARRSALLEPDGDDRAQDRVVFLPGTSFKILDVREPAGGERGAILMREIGANEIDAEGRVDQSRVSLDEMAETSLKHSVLRWAAAEPRRRLGDAARERFGALPGLRPRQREVAG